MKQCTKCKKTKSKSEFTTNKDFDDNLGRICKTCAALYYQEYKQKQIEKYGLEGYRQILWEKRLRTKASRAGVPTDDFNLNKFKSLSITLIDYPDRAFPYSLSHIEFMKKYELSVKEYVYLREKIKSGEYNIL